MIDQTPMTFSTRRRALLLVALLACGASACTSDADSAVSDLSEHVALATSYRPSVADLQAEGLAFDPVSRAFFLGSLTHGSVTRIDAAGREQQVFERQDPLRVTLGMEADAAYRNLWVCSILDDDDKRGSVLQFDLDSLELLHRYELGDVYDKASCNDVCVDGDGVAYVTDRENPNIYRIDPETQTADIWLTHDELKPGLVGLNGIVIADDTMIVTKYLGARLYAIPMDDPAGVRRIKLTGAWLHVLFHPFAGADGIELFEDDLYLAFDAAAYRITPTRDDWSVAHVDRLDEVDTHGGLSAIVAAEGRLYGSNGQAPKYLFGRTPEDALVWALSP